MEISKVIQRVQSLYSKGVQSDDTRLNARHIYNVLVTMRARVIVQELRKNRVLSEWDLQPLHNVKMIAQTAITCNGGKCPFMKSEQPLPTAITADDTENVIITNYNGTSHFARTTFENYKYIVGSKYTSKLPYYFIHDNYLYLINSELGSAYVHGIWRDPIEAYRKHLEYQSKDICIKNGDIEFFTPLELIDGIVQLTKVELIEQFSQLREDSENDGNDKTLE
jgi:hypothetical protein